MPPKRPGPTATLLSTKGTKFMKNYCRAQRVAENYRDFSVFSCSSLREPAVCFSSCSSCSSWTQAFVVPAQSRRPRGRGDINVAPTDAARLSCRYPL